jgi:SNF2 family DNA or RNA helicase
MSYICIKMLYIYIYIYICPYIWHDRESGLKTRFKTDEKCPVMSINWHRIVLDESHKIKGKSGMTNAVRVLPSRRRWCVTGTPLNNAFEDFDGQFSFFGLSGTYVCTYMSEIIHILYVYRHIHI